MGEWDELISPATNTDADPGSEPMAAVELVRGAHRAIRRLDRTESPYAGMLVSSGERHCVRVDVAVVAAELWLFADAEHVLGVQDVMRDAGGQSALLPWCVEPVDTLLTRRTRAERPLVSGEIVTLVGSLLRGVAEVGGRSMTGRWWLDNRVKPLFVPGEGVACGTAASAIVERLRQDCVDRALERALTRICAGMSDHRVVQQSLDDWERELTELAAPRPLDREVHASEHARAIPLHRARPPQEVQRAPGRRSSPARLPQVAMRLEELRMRVAAWLRMKRPQGRLRPRAATSAQHRAPRGRILIVGGAASAVVLLVGLLWPGGGEQPSVPPAAAADTTLSQSASDESRRSKHRPEEAHRTSLTPPQGDLTSAVKGLLTKIEKCVSQKDTECAKAIVAGSGSKVLDLVGAHPTDREATLIEDYGDVAVVRLGSAGKSGEQMLVVAQENDRWLVRDVYDVADQPSAAD